MGIVDENKHLKISKCTNTKILKVCKFEECTCSMSQNAKCSKFCGPWSTSVMAPKSMVA
jgi:hypothetical protein